MTKKRSATQCPLINRTVKRAWVPDQNAKSGRRAGADGLLTCWLRLGTG